MKKIKILTPLVTVVALSGTAMTIVSCGQTQAEKIIPTKLLLMEETTLKGLTDGADISQYNTLVIPESVRIVDTDAFNNSKIDYSSIKTIRFSNGIKQIKKNAFAGLKNLELIDYSNFNIDTITTLTVEQGAFGESLPLYCYIKLPNNIPSSSINELKSKLLTCGLPESWFVEKTEGHVEIASEKKDVKYDGIDPTKIETKLSKSLAANEKIDVSVTKTTGTDKVDIKLVGQPKYVNQVLTYQVELSPDAGKTLADGDYVEYKVTILNKTTTSESNGETTNWVQIIDNCKVTYKTPELYVTGIEVSQTKTGKIYHQGDIINKNDVLIETVFNDRSKATLDYGEGGYTVEGIEDFNIGHTITEAEARAKTLSFTFKYSKKGVGDFSKGLTFNNIALKVETITVNGAPSITRGTNQTYQTTFTPADAQTTINWSIEPYIVGQSTNGISIDQNGVVTVADQADTNPINIVAVDSTNQQTVGKCTNVTIVVPKVQGISFTQSYNSCYRGSEQQKYQFIAKVDDPAAKQDIAYSIEEAQPAAEDEKVTINKDTGELKIGKLAQYNKTWTVVAKATDGSDVAAKKQFKVDIPNPTKIEISYTGSSTMQRYQETRTFKATVYPDGAEQNVNWSATNTSGGAVTGLTIPNGVLTADENVTPQTVKVFAKHNPIVKTGTTACTSDPKNIDITYAKLAKLEIKGGPVDYADPTKPMIARGETASVAFTADITKGAYRKIEWSVDEAEQGDGTSITSAGILTVGKQVKYNNKTYLTVTAKATDEKGDTLTQTQKVYYSIPPIQTCTFNVTKNPTPTVDNIHEAGATFTYSATISPDSADLDLSFEFDKDTSDHVEATSTSTKCDVRAGIESSAGKQYKMKVTTAGVGTSSQHFSTNYTFSTGLTTFANASWDGISEAAAIFEESEQGVDDAKKICDFFSDIDYASGTTAKEILDNFIGKQKKVGSIVLNVIDVCKDVLTSNTSKTALFTFEFDSNIGAISFNDGQKGYEAPLPFSKSYLCAYMKDMNYYKTLSKYIRAVNKIDSNGSKVSMTTFIAKQVGDYGSYYIDYALYQRKGLSTWANKTINQDSAIYVMNENGANWALTYNRWCNWAIKYKTNGRTDKTTCFPIFCI